MVSERRLTLVRPFKAGNSRRVRSRRVATPETRGVFNRRYATGLIHYLIPALKGRAKVSRRFATKSITLLNGESFKLSNSFAGRKASHKAMSVTEWVTALRLQEPARKEVRGMDRAGPAKCADELPSNLFPPA